MNNKKFNQTKYINHYKKANYKRFTAEVNKELAEDIDKLKKEKNLSNRDLLVKGYEKYKNKKD